MTDQKTGDSGKRSWLRRLKDGLSRSAGNISGGITDIFAKRKLDSGALEDLEDLLITADLGITASGKIAQQLADSRFDKNIEPEEVREALADIIADIVEPTAQPLEITPTIKPFVILVVGVNGSGKTTTIGKYARQFREQGKSVMLVAGDTFRAAAIEQLKVWGERAGVPVVAGKQGADASGLAFEGLERAKAEGADVLLVDTAGRLQNKEHLMAELEKIVRVLRKLDPTAPHCSLLVLDATTGQNALSQVEAFGDKAALTGLVMTKLDGSARGGVLVACAEKFGLPIYAIGVGEGVDDLQPFEARAFARALVGLED